MEQNYSIDEILIAVNKIQNKKKEKISLTNKISNVKKKNISIPVNTLKLIEEAEKIKK